MADLATMTAAPIECTVNGQTISVAPLRATDWGRIERWMRAQLLSASATALRDTEDMTEIDKRLFTREAHAQAANISCHDRAAMNGLLASFDGMLFVVGLSANRATPAKKLTPEALEELVGTDIKGLAELMQRILTLTNPTLNSTEQDGEEAKGGGGADPPAMSP